MYTQREICIGALLVYSGFILGFGLLALATIFNSGDMGRWAIAVLAISCTYSIHRAMAKGEERQRIAFDMGRRYEQKHDLTAVR